MQKDTALSVKKKVVVFLHLIFLCLSIFGISLMYLNSHYGSGVAMIHEAKYEDSDEFSAQLQEDIDLIFSYVAYRDILEVNGSLEMSLPMVTIRSSQDQEIVYTIDELVRYARQMGYYLDGNYDIVEDSLISNDIPEPEVYVLWRAYAADDQYTEPGDAYSTLKQLSLDTLNCLSYYYHSYERFFNQPTNLYFQIFYQDTTSDHRLYSNAPDLSDTAMKEMGRYCFLSGDSIIVDSNFQEAPKNIAAYTERYNPYDNNAYYMILAIDTTYKEADVYQSAAELYQQLRASYLEGLMYLALGLIGCCFTLYYLVIRSGYVSIGHVDLHLHGFDMITTESWLALSVIATFFALFLSDRILFKLVHLIVSEENWDFAERMTNAAVIYICCLVSAFSLLRRYKARKLWQNSILYRFTDNIRTYFTYQKKRKSLALIYFIFVVIHFAAGFTAFLLSRIWQHTWAKAVTGSLAFLVLAADIWFFFQLFKKFVQQDQITEAIDTIASGDTSYYVNPDNFTTQEKEVALRLNSIGTGLEAALQEKVKSERLKSDLITNVSHDIKTPLTSIISYVDLIKREDIDNPRIQNYLDVLEQKALRLKNLTEDLVEASKASSGNIKLEIMKIDLVQLVHQTNGEFEEKFATRRLLLVSHLPDESLIISADGRSLWRVLENLYNNAFKYAMESSRIYIDVIHEGDWVCFTIKNISQNPLNIRGEELTERFVRGDVSRSTEGSGLGLSIAQSLTMLQEGTFEISIDGDLFKVSVKFPLEKEEV